MKKKPTKQQFRISLSVFYTFVMTKIGFMLRDLEQFIGYGITEEKLNDLKAKAKAFSDIPTDQELLGIQITATQAKDAAGTELRDAISDTMVRVANKFGTHSGTFRKFGISGVSELDGGQLSYAGKRVHRVAGSLLTALESEGLTPEALDEFGQLVEQFEEALFTKEDAIADRDIATEDRVTKANEVYKLLSKYCDTGKRIWESENEAKFNDYVIYNTPSGTDDKDAEPESEAPGAAMPQ